MGLNGMSTLVNPATPPSSRRHNIMSHPRMSDVGSGSFPLSSSKLSAEHNVSESETNVKNKRRKITFSKSVAMESENPEAHLEPVVMKRKRTSGHSIKGEIKNEIAPAKDKGAAENDIVRLRDKIDKNCTKRMAKLFEKQGVKRQEFDRIWEKKRSDLERDHKLAMSMTRLIWGEGTERADTKLKLLGDGFKKKIKEHNLLKELELKNLKAEQLAARNEERQKRARWLADCDSGEPTANHEPESLRLDSEEVGCNSSNSLSTDPPEVPEPVPTEIVGYSNPVELSNSTSDQGIDDGHAIGLPDSLVNVGDETDEAVGLPSVEQILEPSEQTKASWTPRPCTLLLPQASEGQIPCSSTPDDIQDIGARVVQEQNTSPFEQPNIEIHEQDEPEVANLDAINAAHEESSEKLQDQDVTDLEDQAPPSVTFANSEPVDIVDPVPSSNAGTPAIQNCEELVSIDVFPSCNEPLSVEVEIQSHNLERSSSQTAEVADCIVVSRESDSQIVENRDLQGNHFGLGSGSQVNLERILSQTAEIEDNVVVSHESASQSGQNRDLQNNHFGVGSGIQFNPERISSQTAEITDNVLHLHESTSQLGANQELQSNHFGIGSESQVIHETSVQMSTSSQNNVNVSQIVANTVELPHQTGLQLGSVGNLYGSGNQFFSHQVTSLSSPPLYGVPLQHALLKKSEEIEQLQKSHEELKSQLKSDREKELQEFLAQLNNKYDLKDQEAEAKYSYKKNGLEKGWSKILMNQLLAECFIAVCVDLFRSRGIQQAASSSSSTMQHQTQQNMMRPSLQMSLGHQLVSGHPITTANIQAMQHAPAFSFGSTSTAQPVRPLFNNAFTPTSNPRAGGNVRSGAPHLQPHAASMPTPITHLNIQAIQQQLQLSITARYSPITAPPVQTAQHAPNFSLGSTSQPLRSLFADAITPTPNPSFGGGFRSVAQPLTSAFMPTPTPTLPSFYQNLQLRPSQPLQSPTPPPMQPSTFQNMPQLQRQPPALLNPPLSAPGFSNMDDRANISGNCAPTRINSGFGSLEQSHLARLRRLQGNLTSSAAVNSICLSDDD